MKDAGSNPLSGVLVTFAAPVSGASGSFAECDNRDDQQQRYRHGCRVYGERDGGPVQCDRERGWCRDAGHVLADQQCGDTASVAVYAGSPQSATINTAFATNLQAIVKDAGSNPLSGVVVTFAAPGSGASGAFAGGVGTATTNSSGIATAVAFTANGTAGPYSVTASVAGVATPATFWLTNNAGTPAWLALLCGVQAPR